MTVPIVTYRKCSVDLIRESLNREAGEDVGVRHELRNETWITYRHHDTQSSRYRWPLSASDAQNFQDLGRDGAYVYALGCRQGV